MNYILNLVTGELREGWKIKPTDNPKHLSFLQDKPYGFRVQWQCNGFWRLSTSDQLTYTYLKVPESLKEARNAYLLCQQFQ